MISRKMEALDFEHYVGNEIPAGGLDSMSAEKAATQNPTTMDAREATADNADAERERQLERWMDQIKVFIRNIDVNSL